jgi:hypothetical protein
MINELVSAEFQQKERRDESSNIERDYVGVGHLGGRGLPMHFKQIAGILNMLVVKLARQAK